MINNTINNKNIASLCLSLYWRCLKFRMRGLGSSGFRAGFFRHSQRLEYAVRDARHLNLKYLWSRRIFATLDCLKITYGLSEFMLFKNWLAVRSISVGHWRKLRTSGSLFPSDSPTKSEMRFINFDFIIDIEKTSTLKFVCIIELKITGVISICYGLLRFFLLRFYNTKRKNTLFLRRDPKSVCVMISHSMWTKLVRSSSPPFGRRSVRRGSVSKR